MPYTAIAIGGVVITMLAGWILKSQRVYVGPDRTTEIDVKTLGLHLKMKTQAPIYLMFLVGAFMAIVPLWLMHQESIRCLPQMVTIRGDVQTDGDPIQLVIVAQPHYMILRQNSGPFSGRLPVIPDETYDVYTIRNKRVLWDQAVSISNGVFDVGLIRVMGGGQ